jgi:hypothetical protein
MLRSIDPDTCDWFVFVDRQSATALLALAGGLKRLAVKSFFAPAAEEHFGLTHCMGNNFQQVFS